jgi:hypothetical protein
MRDEAGERSTSDHELPFYLEVSWRHSKDAGKKYRDVPGFLSQEYRTKAMALLADPLAQADLLSTVNFRTRSAATQIRGVAICSVLGCSRVTWARGLCTRDYNARFLRWRSHPELDKAVAIGPKQKYPRTVCRVLTFDEVMAS